MTQQNVAQPPTIEFKGEWLYLTFSYAADRHRHRHHIGTQKKTHKPHRPRGELGCHLEAIRKVIFLV